MSSRANFFSPNDIQEIYLSDFTTNFDLNPVTGSLAKVNNEEAAKQMLRNLVLTIAGERFFQPTVGSKVYNLLFEPADNVTLSALESTISETIRNNLSFVNLLGVNISYMPDANAYAISIVFSLINSIKSVTLDIVLRRVR